MKITDFLRPDLVIPKLRGQDKQSVLEELTEHLATRVTGLTRDHLLQVLLDREALASTAIGEGVAIPHGKLNSIDRLSACIGRSPEGVDFKSMDGHPTYIFVTLVAPEHSTGEHLKALARISRLFKDADFRSRLMAAQDGEEIYRLVASEDSKY